MDFKEFLRRFPKRQLPLALTSESRLDIQGEHDMADIPLDMVQQFLSFELQDPEEAYYAEYLPCIHIEQPQNANFEAVIYWTASIKGDRFRLCTFQKNGKLIDQLDFAGTHYEDSGLTYSVGTIDADWKATVRSGLKALNSDAAFLQKGGLELVYQIDVVGNMELVTA